MPGITGIIGEDLRCENKGSLDTMVKCLLHEQFYTSGGYTNEQLGLWIGWTADTDSFSNCSPIWNEKKDICLIFSGEEFSDRADINGLKSKGHDFDPESASYLVHMYEELGPKFF